ncbi:MAG: ABC transporter permease subunit [Planctomycetota bacterium]
MILAIAWTTALECLRRPLPYIAVATVFTLSLASCLLNLFTFGAGALEASNLTMSGVLLAGLAATALVGTALVRRDLERGTLALLLSQPVGLGSYVAGRFLGLAAATLIVGALAAAGVAGSIFLAGAPAGLFSSPLLMGCTRVMLALIVLAAAALAVSAATSRIFAPLVLLVLFLAGDVAPSSMVSRVLPNFGLFGLDAGSAPALAWLSLYAMLYCVVFLMITYLQLALRTPTRTES